MSTVLKCYMMIMMIVILFIMVCGDSAEDVHIPNFNYLLFPPGGCRSPLIGNVSVMTSIDGNDADRLDDENGSASISHHLLTEGDGTSSQIHSTDVISFTEGDNTIIDNGREFKDAPRKSVSKHRKINKIKEILWGVEEKERNGILTSAKGKEEESKSEEEIMLTMALTTERKRLICNLRRSEKSKAEASAFLLKLFEKNFEVAIIPDMVYISL